MKGPIHRAPRLLTKPLLWQLEPVSNMANRESPSAVLDNYSNVLKLGPHFSTLLNYWPKSAYTVQTGFLLLFHLNIVDIYLKLYLLI